MCVEKGPPKTDNKKKGQFKWKCK